MTKQIPLSTTAVEIIGEDESRTSFSIQNHDSTISVYIGKVPTVSSSTGFLLPAGAVIEFYKKMGDNTRQRRYAVAASGTPTISIEEEYGD